ncbi:MAG: TIGR00296 family protein [Candidatus Micrarchaeota archaeon]
MTAAQKLTAEQGKTLLRIARGAIARAFSHKEVEIPHEQWLKDKAGIFVTVHNPDDSLRGCIGYTESVMSLRETVKNAAVQAAFHDPRFEPVKENEVDRLKIEITILTKPEEIIVSEPRELLKKVIIGRDGLIAKYGPYSGLLLPQVPVAENWDVETFLGQTCWKAGLDPSSWLDKKTKFFKFEGQIFAETKSGAVVEKKMMRR